MVTGFRQFCTALEGVKCQGGDKSCAFFKTERQFAEDRDRAITINRKKNNCKYCKYQRYRCELSEYYSTGRACKETIGEKIRKLRCEREVTQLELARIVGTTKQNIYKYENNIITNIPTAKIEIIAKYFNVSPGYLMGWTEINGGEENETD